MRTSSSITKPPLPTAPSSIAASSGMAMTSKIASSPICRLSPARCGIGGSRAERRSWPPRCRARHRCGFRADRPGRDDSELSTHRHDRRDRGNRCRAIPTRRRRAARRERGYNGGLGALARDFGVTVDDEPPPDSPKTGTRPQADQGGESSRPKVNDSESSSLPDRVLNSAIFRGQLRTGRPRSRDGRLESPTCCNFFSTREETR